MRTLHVAALPYPSQQGTQALLHAMLSALAAAGHETHLVCLGHGAFARETAYFVHPVEMRLLKPSLRSGPSVAKLVLDVALARRLHDFVRRIQPDVVVAHHVEAAACAWLMSSRPFVFVAHTSLAHELETYFPRLFAGLLRRAGGVIDRFLCQRAARVLTVSPRLAQLLAANAQREAHALPIPWEPAPCIAQVTRAEARRRLALATTAEVMLYAGNLDGYQGLDPLLEGVALLARERASLRLLLATQAPSAKLRRKLDRLGLTERTLIVSLADELDRCLVHAAADVVLVPRKSEGGIPIKLLDALARDARVIATERATAGFAMAQACHVIANDDPSAFCAALRAHFSAPSPPDRRGTAYLRKAHAPAQFVAQFLSQLERSERCPSFFRGLIVR